jgi:hypothetical protein
MRPACSPRVPGFGIFPNIQDINPMDSEGLFQQPKKRIYVCHDHFADGQAYETFKRLFSSRFDIVRDQSLERELGSNDGEGFVRSLREGPMRDCACAVVLCGKATHADTFVDWEIKAALEERIGLAGVILPANPLDAMGMPLLPDRLQANFDGGYAVICRWDDLVSTKVDLGARLNFAMDRDRILIRNDLPLRSQRN